MYGKDMSNRILFYLNGTYVTYNVYWRVRNSAGDDGRYAMLETMLQLATPSHIYATHGRVSLS